ncbi:ABC transporter ATP-binding protein, partial [Rugamonas sp. FT82W]|nr:ABC transporter ATP-binding protein [Duganella vulcania]
VSGAQSDGNALDIGLADASHAPATLAWLAADCASAGVALLHFATAKTSLENIFLNLTGRSLRD